MASQPEVSSSKPSTEEPEEVWTQVKRKSRSSGKRNNIQAPFNTHSHTISSPSLGGGNYPARSVSDIAAEYRTLRAQWQDSKCRASLCAILDANSTSLRHPISRAICLGIGSFDPPDGGWETKRKTYLQLIAFLTMVEKLQTIQGVTIPCVFQEPVFTENDKTFLTNIGHQVVDSPKACDLIDGDALLFGVHLYRPIYAMALKSTAPALFVGTGWDIWDQVDLSPEPGTDLANLRHIERTFTKYPFPQDATTTAFSSTSIYFKATRKPTEIDRQPDGKH